MYGGTVCTMYGAGLCTSVMQKVYLWPGGLERVAGRPFRMEWLLWYHVWEGKCRSMYDGEASPKRDGRRERIERVSLGLEGGGGEADREEGDGGGAVVESAAGGTSGGGG